MALFSVPKHSPALSPAAALQPLQGKPAHPAAVQARAAKRYYLLPFFVSCSQGVLFFELPLSQGKDGMVSTGILLSLLSLGALATLSLLFLNRLSPSVRIAAALLGMALSFFTLAAFTSVPPGVVLFLLGAAKGVLFPAMASLFISLGSGGHLGRTFSLQSIAMSLGAFAGPVAAGQLRDFVSPYFIAFVLLMTAILLLPPKGDSKQAPYRTGLNSHAA
ncbi:Major Facilitator Superfamily protein [compost metagenome]